MIYSKYETFYVSSFFIYQMCQYTQNLNFTLMPVLLLSIIFAFLGIIMPLTTYKFTLKHSIVERLRAE